MEDWVETKKDLVDILWKFFIVFTQMAILIVASVPMTISLEITFL
jgi:hypothetical protein